MMIWWTWAQSIGGICIVLAGASAVALGAAIAVIYASRACHYAWKETFSDIDLYQDFLDWRLERKQRR